MGKKYANRTVGSYKKGGKVKKTGLAKVHKGERVLTAKDQQRLKKALKKMKSM